MSCEFVCVATARPQDPADGRSPRCYLGTSVRRPEKADTVDVIQYRIVVRVLLSRSVQSLVAYEVRFE